MRRFGTARRVWHHARARWSEFQRDQRGGVVPFIVLGFAGLMVAGTYAFDTVRMTSSAAQVKRATDAAAMAVGMQKLEDFRIPVAQLEQTAREYVLQNLGMDSSLRSVIGADSVALVVGKSEDGADTYQVRVDFQVDATLLRGASARVSVASKTKVFNKPAEVALVLPNTLSETAGELEVLRRLGKAFSRELLGDGVRPGQGNIWISLVPYSQSVNIYDSQAANRITRWARPGALRPVELTSLFRTGYAGLADRRIPDRRANLLCMYRGMRARESYFWDEPPVGQFGVYYRADLPENGSPGASPISWVGPNPFFGKATGDNDTRWLVADRGCPHAALLPLTDKLDAIDARLDEMDTRFNINYAIAMGWAAAALSPAMRGGDGWGDAKLPLDFNDSDVEGNTKFIIMLANTTGNWFDTDAYNFGGPNDPARHEVGDSGTGSAVQVAARRFVLLCESFRERNLKFFFLGVRPGDPKDFGRNLFDDVAVPGMQVCAGNGGEVMFANASSFVAGEAEIQRKLEDIASAIKSKSSYVRLVE